MNESKSGGFDDDVTPYMLQDIRETTGDLIFSRWITFTLVCHTHFSCRWLSASRAACVGSILDLRGSLEVAENLVNFAIYPGS